ncbi:serine-rich adhesin for platelets-like isoform X3 [Frieseomelitta varia]|uniref:serine-rich adhesin for platelets-like isoform X3 n=1 Tax=Frieseomelitta varia TaxID=561572 RepID=UPI001CB6A0F1|nr:serine-rich adhesin for platelets-like isoform X3 [Frieseomelitta varia]
MVRRFSWCTAVALVVLLFVTTEGLRERGAQTDDHKAANRGTLKYNSKSPEEATTASSASSLSRSRTNRDRSVQSRRFSNIEGTTQASTINSESSSSESSIIRTTKRDSTSTATQVTDGSDKKVEEVGKTEPAVNRRNGKRYFPENDEETRSKDNEQRVSVETSRGISRRTSNGRSNSSRITERLDNKGPSVFLATTEPSRSRTGRKIQTTYSKKDLKTQLSTSRRHSNKKFENEFTTTSYRRGRSTTERIERSTRSGRSRVNNEENDSVTRRGPDTLLSESESVRVDIPLVVNGTGNRSTNGSSLISQRRSDTKESSRSGRTGSERSKNRGRSNDAEVAGSSRGSSGSRRGSSKFGDSTTTTEANELVVSSRRNTVSRDRSRSFEQSSGKKNSATESRSRSRGRNLENNVKSSSNDGPERDAKRKVAGERSSSERRSRVLDGVSRVIESRGQDGQDARGRSRNRSRPDVVTPVNTDVTTTVAPETTVLVDVTTIDSEVTTIRPTTPATTSSSKSTSRPSPTSTSTTEASGRGRGRGRGGRKQKEDFFNYGLGFRGRKPSPEGSSNATQPRKTILWKNDTPINGNPGWTLRRRPGNFNNTANPSRTIVPSSRDQTNEVIPPNDESTSTEVAATTTESSTTSSSRRGFKKLQTIDESSTVAGTTAKSYRRGNKTFGNGKATADREESDNYPPEFKARLTQLKNTNTKIPAPKTTSRTQLEEQERRIYGRRSRNNSMAFEPDDLETAASANVLTDESLVVNPLTLINGRGLRRVKKSSAALFAERSRMKLDLARRLVKPELNIEENDLDATTASSFSKPRATGGVPVLDETSKVTEHGKPAATASGGRSNRPSTSVESSREEVNVKSSRKDHEDSSKVTGRPNGLKKGRIIAERMVTSISIEERTAIEETTKPYVLSTNPSATLPAEQGSETVVDSSRIRLSGGRAGKKSKEEDSTIKNMKVSLYSTRRTESSDHVTTVKPKKPYVYQSRNTKFQLQEQSTAIEQRSTTPSPKKPYAPTHRKSQTSQQDDAAKKTKFSNSAGKPIFRPRYSKRAKEKSLDEKKTDDEATITAKVPVPTSRYSRKKSLVNSIDDGSITTERSATQTKKLEFRPRTATYRRHSEVPTTLIESSTKVDRRAGVAITPRSTKYHATLRTTTASPRSVAQEPRMSLKIANESASGIIDSSNGDTGNSNIFNPTRSTFLSGNNTLLEQLRSTVAPLLSSLGNKTPVFSESYSNVNNANSPARITPSGQPPRFSARYKGAELFVRKQNNIYQPTVPSITSSSTTPVTPVENSGSAPPIDISSPGEPRFLTLYQALESASIRNEQLLRNASLQLQEQRSDRVSQVDSNATAIANVIGDNVNNDTTSPTVATVSPQTPDTIANTTQDSTQTPRLSEDPENSTPPVIAAVPETPTTTDSVFTSAEPSSSTEQASTSAESLSSTEQISTSTDSSSTLEQISVRVGSVPVTEPASTESSSQAADETTTNVTDAEDVRNSTTNQELVSSTTDASTTSSVSEASSTELDVTSRVDVSETTTVTNTATTSENPEINTIPLSDVTVTQIADISSTDASTTEMDSNNANNVETTTTTSTSTIRTRLIDFAEDILSRLQATLSTTMLPSQDSTTTLPPAIDTEISNVVSGSNGNRSLESLSQLRDETTTSQGVTTDQSSLGTTEEVTTENAVGSITTSSSTMVPSREVDTQDELNAFTSTTPATTTTATVTQDSQTVSNTDSTIVRDSNDSSSPTLDVEVTTASIVTSTNDTLLTELMSIAKTLLSEEINSSQEATARQNSNVTSRLGDTMGNEIDRPSLSNDVLSTTTQATETSSVLLDVTTESVDSMSTTVVAPKSSTFFVDTPQNEVDSTTAENSSENSTDTSTTIPRSNMSDDKVESVRNETTPVALGPFAEIVESTTPVEFTTEIGSLVTLSNRGSIDPDTTTQTQTIISTQSSDTTVTSTVNYELTTNTFNLFSSNLVTTMNPQTASDQVAGSVTELAATTVTSQLVTDTGTFESEVTTIAPETIPSLVNTITTTPFVPAETNQTVQTTTTPTIGSVQRVETNQTTESTTQLVPLTTETADNETLEATTLSITTTAPLDVNFMERVAINQSLLTSSPMPSTETTTNTPSENIPQTTPTLENETPTVVARFQDTTSTTAQRTAGSRIGQTTEISTPTIPDSSTTPSLFTESPTSSSPESSLATTTSFSVETTTATTTTETTTPTSIGRVPDGGTSTPQTTTMGIVTVTPLTETTTATTTTTVNIEENLVSTETTTSTSPASSDGTTATPTFTSTPGGVPTEATTTMSVQTTPGTQTTTSPKSRLTFQSPTTPYLGRFGGNRLTPAPRFSTSSSTRAPLRDYLVYGIYPNKTIVRKRPEDNLIDARNVDSPYVIFGIFPDGRLVRKFPNGTIIPDPPRRPVEVVFTLSTSTTTNRPPPRPYYNQANQGTYNQYRGPVYDNNGRPVAETTRNAQTPGTIDARLSGNAIVGPNGGGPDNTGPLGTPASLPSINETSNALLNTQMGTASVTPIVSTGRPPTDSQGGRIVQGRERDEATRTKEAGGQRSSVYIGQTATKEGPSPAVSSFENLLNNQPDRRVTAPPGFPWRDPLDQIFGITTSSPVITASVASNTLDDSSEPNGPISARPINPFVEVFTPFSNAIGVPRANIGSIPPPPPPSTPVASSTTPTPTTTMASPITTTITTTTTTIATTMAPTTITTMAPTISTVTARTTTPEPATTAQRPNIASQVETSRTSTSSQTNSLDLQKNLLNPQQQNAFGTTFDDLVFLNSLLQSNSRTTTQKTLTQVEQLLANKILELALKNPGPTRSPKAINTENPPPNSIYKSSTKSPSEPIIIELSSSSATSTPTWKSVETQQPTSQKPTISSATPVQVTWKPVTTTTTERIETSTVPSSTTIKTTLISTTKASVTVKAKPATTPRPKTTTQAPLGFAGLLWQTLLGGNIFGPSTTPKPAKAKPVPKTTQKAVNITPKPLQTTERTETTTIPSTTTLKTVDISKIQVSSPNSIINEKSVTTPAPISTTGQPLINNPNPRLPNVVTSTYSPEDDAKFLVELLRAVEQDNKIGSSKKKSSGLTRDDEAFLRAILSGRALTTPPAPPSTTEVGNAALLAALLKAQGIEPSTPANNIREQLQLASLGQSVTSTPATSPASESTTITTRPASTAANRPTDTTKKSVTPRPTSGPRTRTTIWSPSSTYPPPLFSSFVPVQSAGNNSGSSALIGATRAFSQFLGAAISGAAQQLQSLVRNGTRIVSEVVG